MATCEDESDSQLIWAYHSTSIENVRSIFSRGAILSDVAMRKEKIPFVERADPEIKQSRRAKTVLISGQLVSVGFCVPFYFTTNSTMGYTLRTVHNVDTRENVYLCVHLSRVVSRLRWVVTTDNAASHRATCVYTLEDAEEVARKATAVRVGSYAKDDGRQAELLIQELVPISFIGKIYTCRPEQRDYLRAIANEFNFDINLIQSRERLYR